MLEETRLIRQLYFAGCDRLILIWGTAIL